MAWTQEVNPSAEYADYPLAVLPAAGEAATSADMVTLMTDVYNRLEFLKQAGDTNAGHITNIETGTGLTKTQDTAHEFSGTFLEGVIDFVTALETLDDTTAGFLQLIGFIDANVGGDVIGFPLSDYSSTFAITNGESHHVSIGKIDAQLETTNTTASGAATASTTNGTNITNVANKVGDSATTAGTGFEYDSTNYIANNDKLKVAVEKLDNPLGADRRILDRLYELSVLNWRDTAFGESGGATPDSYAFETMSSAGKIDAGNSSGTLDVIQRRFGDPDGAWTYVSSVFTVPANTNRVKLRFSVTGTVSLDVNLAGSPTTGFVSVPDEDTYVTVPAGTQLVVRAQGGAGAYINSYAALVKEV